ncbi:DMT family transporter [Bacillus sp. JCM 19041]|uniref:DMT family transporter n=1 Tax=Bacillus sp. JCM 19041 TaxID=1460637 RepID=UPI003369C86A
MNSSTFLASFYALIAVCFWGISFVSAKAVLPFIDSSTLLLMRFGIGALFLFILLLFSKGAKRPSLRYIPHLFVLSVIGVFVHQLLQLTALLTIDASAAGWMISFAPVFTVALSIVFLHERLTTKKAVGIVTATIGVFLIISGAQGQTVAFSVNIGYFLMLLSTLNWAGYSILLKRMVIPLPPLAITFYTCLIGALLSVPLFITNDGVKQLQLIGAVEWSHLLFLGIFVSGIAYWCWSKAIHTLGASRSSSFLYVEPIATLIAAVLLLHEKIILISMLGGVIIIGGVILMNRSGDKSITRYKR